MRDVTSVHLAVTAHDLAAAVPLTIRFDTVARDRAGLRQVAFSLNQPVPYRHEERIGRSTRTFGPGARAVWRFGT